MPASPGLIPLCWEDLIDWTNDATTITEHVYQRNKEEDSFGTLLSAANLSPKPNLIMRGIRFVPYVSIHETEEALKKLASQSYMERAQFYQESVRMCLTKNNCNQSHLCAAKAPHI